MSTPPLFSSLIAVEAGQIVHTGTGEKHTFKTHEGHNILILGNPDIDIVYTHRKNGNTYLLDTRRGGRDKMKYRVARAKAEGLARGTEKFNTSKESSVIEDVFI